MKEINIKKDTEKFLVNYFKKFVGKYVYFTYSKDKLMSIFFIKEVDLRKGNAKAKISYYKKEKNEISSGRWILIRGLKDKWIVVNKKELKKLLILENLK